MKAGETKLECSGVEEAVREEEMGNLLDCGRP